MKNIEAIFKKYQNELTTINTELTTLPDGYLNKRGKVYYQVVDKKEIGITKDVKLIRQLARKKYIFARKKELENNIKMFSNPKNTLIERAPKTIIDSLSRTYQAVPFEFFFHSQVSDWVAAPFKQNPYLPEQRKYLSNGGVKLRSKSEVLIANQLEAYNIPFRYDAEQKLRGRTIYPDFIIRNPFTGDFIIWEHFGALHKEDYEQKMNQKMRDYLKLGYTPLVNIIYTFEADVESPKRIKQLIEDVILK